MTRPDLDAIQARCDAATPEPWCWRPIKLMAGGHVVEVGPLIRGDMGCVVARINENDGSPDDDSIFITHARTDVPALLAYVRELEAEAKVIRDINDQLGGRVDELEGKRPPRDDAGSGSFCAQCGFDVFVDEDGCCRGCGSDALGDGADEAHALRKRVAELEAAVRQRDERIGALEAAADYDPWIDEPLSPEEQAAADAADAEYGPRDEEITLDQAFEVVSARCRYLEGQLRQRDARIEELEAEVDRFKAIEADEAAARKLDSRIDEHLSTKADTEGGSK